MADIAKCASGETCPLRTRCYRYLVTPGSRQSYAYFPEIGSKCTYFIPDNSELEVSDRNPRGQEKALRQSVAAE
jgi:hypothetical protein